MDSQKQYSLFRKNIYQVIYETDTRAGKIFDVILLIAILISVLIVILESVVSIKMKIGEIIRVAEWMFTILFSLEYILRIYSVKKAGKYLFSFYGIIDFLAIIPTYLGLLLSGAHVLMTIRALRLIRVFRVLKLVRFLGASKYLAVSIKGSLPKIAVFLIVVLIIIIIAGSLMYLIEGPQYGFSSIPKGIYWAIVTLTTVGYGDITPHTTAGQILSSLIMILGYSIIAVPTGIITSQMTKTKQKVNTQTCLNCNYSDHDDDATYCKKCGEKL